MSPQHWPAPRATTPVDARVMLPGSKSLTNRALVLAALADGSSVLRRPLRSRDTRLMVEGLRALGADVTEETGDGPDGRWRVTGGGAAPAVATVDVGNAGTVARFLPPVAALAASTVGFDGDPRIRQRPLAPLVTALRRLGATIDDAGRGRLPFTVFGRGDLAGGAVTLDASSSSQFVSGLLLAAPSYRNGVVVRHRGPPLPSAGHLAMTVAELRAVGAEVDDSDPLTWHVAPGPLRPTDRAVQPDLSSAAPFLAAAVATAGTVRIPDWPHSATQPGALLPGFLTEMGASCSLDDDGLTLRGGDEIVGIDADLRHCGELTPVLTAVAALARTPSRLHGVGHLRGQETDRLAALTTEVNRLGGAVTESDDALVIRPRPLHGGTFHTYDDHRLAMAAAVLGLAINGVVIEDVATTGKTLPGFVELWEAMLSSSGRPGPAPAGRTGLPSGDRAERTPPDRVS